MARAYVSIGSNVERETHIREACRALRERYRGLQLSSVYESAAVGFEGAAFFNLVAVFETGQEPLQVIEELKAIEDRFGRDRSQPKFSDRSLDLDLLLYDDRVDAELGIPRDEITGHAHVLAPLAELIPEQQHPVLGQTYRDLWQQFSDQRQELWVVDFQPLNDD